MDQEKLILNNIGQSLYSENLNRIFNSSERVSITKNSKVVVFSDLHMGDNSSTDDFKRNSSLFLEVAKHYYCQQDYHLILNGDIEELQRFNLKTIMNSWPQAYNVFMQFHYKKQLWKTVGNHDISLGKFQNDYPFPIYDSIVLEYGYENIFIFHGHQTSKKYSASNDLIGLTLKYLANPLGIKNFSVSHDSRKQYKTEKRAYLYSKQKKIISIIGHTHRPLFESLSKSSRLKYKIEQLCRDLSSPEPTNDEKLMKIIRSYKNELENLNHLNNGQKSIDSLYNEIFHIPCIFNSGTTIGKRGITCLEIKNGKISLVHWFDRSISKKHLRNTGYSPEPFGNNGIYRMVVNEESLNYIFTRIKVLS